MARASGRQLVDVDKETLVRITRVEGEHAVVDVLLQTGALVARSQSATSSTDKQTGLDTLSLSVVGDILDDDSPFSSNVLGTQGTSIGNIRWADKSLTTDPVALVELLSIVERIVKFILLFFGNSINQIVS